MQANERRLAVADGSRDDALTLVALGIVAFVVADVAHEGLGHGLATLAVGAKPVMLTTCYFSSSGSLSRWIPAAGGIAMWLWACYRFWLCARCGWLGRIFVTFSRSPLHSTSCLPRAIRLYSGIAAFGDWAAVISGLTPAWLWRVLLVVFSAVAYYLSLKLLAVEMRPFCASNAPEALTRLRRITLIPYLAALVAACLAGAFNPADGRSCLPPLFRAPRRHSDLRRWIVFLKTRSSEPSVLQEQSRGAWDGFWRGLSFWFLCWSPWAGDQIRPKSVKTFDEALAFLSTPGPTSGEAGSNCRSGSKTGPVDFLVSELRSPIPAGTIIAACRFSAIHGGGRLLCLRADSWCLSPCSACSRLSTPPASGF